MLTKLIASLLVCVSLAAGAVAASTAYLPKLSAVPRAGSDAEAALTLAAPAGIDPEAAEEPLVAAGTKLTDEVLDRLLAASNPPVERIKVKEFSLGRWDLAWLFGLSVLGLGGGAGLVRLEARRAITAMAPSATRGAAANRTPRETLVEAHTRLGTLAATRHSVAAGDRRQRVLHELDAVRAECFEPFVELRPRIVAAVGMSGYARVMDSFAAAERAFNRAWSAAADSYPQEAEESLQVGVARLAEAIERAPD